jgi:amphi-Trp domain-containing protein
MVRIRGRPGKFMGSPTSGDVFEQEFYLTAEEAAIILRNLADEVAAKGKVEASAGDWNLAVNPREPLKMEVQYKHNPMRRELEFQLKLKENP